MGRRSGRESGDQKNDLGGGSPMHYIICDLIIDRLIYIYENYNQVHVTLFKSDISMKDHEIAFMGTEGLNYHY